MRRSLAAAAAALALLVSGPLGVAPAAQARPTDGALDPFYYGYSVPAAKKCSKNICVYWVPTSADAATDAFASHTLGAWQKSWNVMVDKLGFRKPLADGKLGGNKKFDVYLKDLSATASTSVCPQEKVKNRWFIQTYCMVENDFLNPQYSGVDSGALAQVTAAKALFTAVQYAYDSEEDKWFADATGTWMEEKIFGSANLNRRYLANSQIMEPHVPLDTWVTGTNYPYANWIFLEFLTKRYGKKTVRAAWQRAAADNKDDFSLKAVDYVLRKRGGFEKAYAEFAAWNTRPARFYRDGGSWPQPVVAATTLSRSVPRYAAPTVRLHHQTSNSTVLTPDASLAKKSWKLKVRVKGPKRKKMPALFVLVEKKKGGFTKVFGKFNRRGKAKVVVPFSTRKVRSVTVTVANASIRYRCFRGTSNACQGVAKDDNQAFTWSAKASR
ncbi:MAG: MXAN_6640 family putative metalloprotease [Nocardioides sp.]|jgi:hypothetical protein